MVPNNKLHKDWQRYIKCHFDQPLAKKHRATRRRQKAATKAPRPLNKLRPVVNCPTQRYNMRLRAGRGFSLLELRKAGIVGGAKYARTIGIAVDARRSNKSQESLNRNVQRLRRYMSSLVLFPIRPKNQRTRKNAGNPSKAKEDEKENKDKPFSKFDEKMIKYFMAQERAKQRLRQYKRFSKDSLPFGSRCKAVSEVVTVADVPTYDVKATLRSEWAIGKHHFKWRRSNMRLAAKRKAEAAKKKAKEAKGK